MRKVSRPSFEPHVCAITLRGEDPDGFYEPNINLTGLDPWVSLSHSGLAGWARENGWLSPEAKAEMDDRIAALEAERDRVAEDLVKVKGAIEAIDALESAGFVARKKPGRPAKPKTEADG